MRSTCFKIVTAIVALTLLLEDNYVVASDFEAGTVKAASTSTKKSGTPGICEETTDCESGYECVALQTTREGTEEVKQCLPKVNDTDVCSGQFAGLCPTFASWEKPYNSISSVCTYKPAAAKCALPGTTSKKNTVVCVSGAVDDSGEKVDVIYGCVDFDTTTSKLLFGEDDDGAAQDLVKALKSNKAVEKACLDPKGGSSLLCYGQGTCNPITSPGLEYACTCLVGFEGDYCNKVVSNKCQLPGQCAMGVCNLAKKECECEAGFTGDQCSECDPTSDKACSGNGKCSNSKCKCDEGYEGDQCAVKKQVKKPATSAPAPAPGSDNSTSAASTSSLLASSVAISIMTIFYSLY